MDQVPPERAYLLPYIHNYLAQGHERNSEYVQINAAATKMIYQEIGVYATPRIKPATTAPWATTTRGARVHAYQPRTPCRLSPPDNQITVIFADASDTTGLTPAAAGAALELRPDATGQLRHHHLTGATIFGASSSSELKTMAIILDTVGTSWRTPQDERDHVSVLVDAAVDFQIIRRLATQTLHKATESSLGTQTLHLWVALRTLTRHVILHLIKQESHPHNLGNGHIDLHAHNQFAEHMPNPDEPPLQDHMHTHLQHLHANPRAGEPPQWVPNDLIYHDTGRAYHYPQPLRTMAHIQGGHADNILMARLNQELQTTLYFSALDPSLLPVHVQKRGAQLLLEQLPLLHSVEPWYSRKDIDIPPEYTICQCHLQQPETWDHFTRCPLAQEDIQPATWKPENTIAQHAGWGLATPPANDVRRLLRKPEIKGTVLRGAVPVVLY